MNESLFKSINDLTKALIQRNFLKFKSTAHNLKSSAGYIGAGNIHYDCYFIQKYFKTKDFKKMAERYNRLIEDSVEFMLFSHNFLKTHSEDKEFIDSIDVKEFKPEQIQLADNYKLVQCD